MGIFEDTKEYLEESKYHCIVIREETSGYLGSENERAVFLRGGEFVMSYDGEIQKYLSEEALKSLMRDHKWQKKELSDINCTVNWDALQHMEGLDIPFLEEGEAEGVRWVCVECGECGTEKNEYQANQALEEHEGHEENGIVEYDVEKILPQIADNMSPEDDDFFEKSMTFFSDVDLSEGIY